MRRVSVSAKLYLSNANIEAKVLLLNSCVVDQSVDMLIIFESTSVVIDSALVVYIVIRCLLLLLAEFHRLLERHYHSGLYH